MNPLCCIEVTECARTQDVGTVLRRRRCTLEHDGPQGGMTPSHIRQRRYANLRSPRGMEDYEHPKSHLMFAGPRWCTASPHRARHSTNLPGTVSRPPALYDADRVFFPPSVGFLGSGGRLGF